jgi:DNA-binding response OmpR family regulator
LHTSFAECGGGLDSSEIGEANAILPSAVPELRHSGIRYLVQFGSSVMAVAQDGTFGVGLVTEDVTIGGQLARQLTSQGIHPTAIACTRLASQDAIDIDVLVVAIPTLQGFRQLCQRHFDYCVGILAVESSQCPEIRASWLDAGAHDCISLPTTAIELCARVRALGRRSRMTQQSTSVIRTGQLLLHLPHRDAYLCGNRLDLTSHEFDLLVAFAKSAGQVLSRERLLELTNGSADESFDRAIDVRVSRLRSKLGDDPRNPHLLKTVRGRGYLLSGD